MKVFAKEVVEKVRELDQEKMKTETALLQLSSYQHCQGLENEKGFVVFISVKYSLFPPGLCRDV